MAYARSMLALRRHDPATIPVFYEDPVLRYFFGKSSDFRDVPPDTSQKIIEVSLG